MFGQCTEIARRIRTQGLDPACFTTRELLGAGAYSLVFEIGAPGQVFKVTSCLVSIQLLRVLQAQPQEDFVQVFDSYDLGKVGPSKMPVQGFLLERLATPTEQRRQAFEAGMAAVASQVLGRLGKPPKRGTTGYAEMQYRYCIQAAQLDLPRQAAWAWLANHLCEYPDEYRSVDVMTEGNMLLRGDRLVFSDPIRRVVYS